ncbi:hypothetical protein HID58_046844, partial [Brassica napus]
MIEEVPCGALFLLWNGSGCGSSTLNCNGGIDLASVSNVMLNEGLSGS